MSLDVLCPASLSLKVSCIQVAGWWGGIEKGNLDEKEIGQCDIISFS